MSFNRILPDSFTQIFYSLTKTFHNKTSEESSDSKFQNLKSSNLKSNSIQSSDFKSSTAKNNNSKKSDISFNEIKASNSNSIQTFISQIRFVPFLILAYLKSAMASLEDGMNTLEDTTVTNVTLPVVELLTNTKFLLEYVQETFPHFVFNLNNAAACKGFIVDDSSTKNTSYYYETSAYCDDDPGIAERFVDISVELGKNITNSMMMCMLDAMSPTCNGVGPSNNGSGNAGKTAGIVIGSLIGLCALCICVGCIYSKCKDNQENNTERMRTDYPQTAIALPSVTHSLPPTTINQDETSTNYPPSAPPYEAPPAYNPAYVQTQTIPVNTPAQENQETVIHTTPQPTTGASTSSNVTIIQRAPTPPPTTTVIVENISPPVQHTTYVTPVYHPPRTTFIPNFTPTLFSSIHHHPPRIPSPCSPPRSNWPSTHHHAPSIPSHPIPHRPTPSHPPHHTPPRPAPSHPPHHTPPKPAPRPPAPKPAPCPPAPRPAPKPPGNVGVRFAKRR